MQKVNTVKQVAEVTRLYLLYQLASGCHWLIGKQKPKVNLPLLFKGSLLPNHLDSRRADHRLSTNYLGRLGTGSDDGLCSLAAWFSYCLWLTSGASPNICSSGTVAVYSTGQPVSALSPQWLILGLLLCLCLLQMETGSIGTQLVLTRRFRSAFSCATNTDLIVNFFVLFVYCSTFYFFLFISSCMCMLLILNQHY